MGLVLRSAASLAIPAHLSDNSPPAAEEPLRLASDAAPPLSAGRPSSNDGAQLGPKSRLDLVDAGPFSAGGLAPKPRLRKSDKKEDVFFILIDMHPVFRKQTSYYLYHIITCYSLNNANICKAPFVYQFIFLHSEWPRSSRSATTSFVCLGISTPPLHHSLLLAHVRLCRAACAALCCKRVVIAASDMGVWLDRDPSRRGVEGPDGARPASSSCFFAYVSSSDASAGSSATSAAV